MLFAEAFNELLQPEETASFFLNIVHHFFSYESGVVYPTGIGRPPLATRAVDHQTERQIARLLTQEWLENFRRDLRPTEIVTQGEKSHIAVPLVFGSDMPAYAILVCSAGMWKGPEKDIIRVLGRAAGAALGRIYQARRIEEERDYAKAIFFSIVSAIINVDAHGVIYESNAAAQDLLSGDGTILGKHYRDLFGFTSTDPIRECLEKGIARQHIDAPGRDGILWGLTASPLKIGARASGAIVGFRDLSREIPKILR